MHTTKGASLIEILISFFILSLLLLGLDAAQLTSLRQVKTAYYFSVANQQLSNMAERLRTIKEGDSHSQLAWWNQQNATLLPQGKGNIQGSYPHYSLSIKWGQFTEQTCHQPKIGLSGCLTLLINL